MNESSLKRVLNRQRLFSLIGELESRNSGSTTTVYLKAGMEAADITTYVHNLTLSSYGNTSIATTISRSGTGGIIIHNPEKTSVLLPPFPINASCSYPHLELGPLKDLITPAYTIGFVLVRLGAFAVGVARGETLLTSKVGTGNIHGRHRQGGSSANRFRRHREKQTEYFMTRLCSHARDHIEPYEKELDFLAYGGAWTTILELKKQCGFLARLDKPELPFHLDIPDPRLRVLESTIKKTWTTTLHEWAVIQRS